MEGNEGTWWHGAISYLRGCFRDHWAPPGGERPERTAVVMGSTAAGGEPHLGTGGEAPLQPLRLASGHKQEAVRPVCWMS